MQGEVHGDCVSDARRADRRAARARRRARPRAAADAALRDRVDGHPRRVRGARRAVARQPGRPRPRRRTVVLRADDRARPRRLRRLGRVRRDGPRVLGVRAGRLPAAPPRPRMADADLLADGRRRRRRSSFRLLVLHFAGSWVFLYPLPFHGAGRLGRAATAIFLSLGAARRPLDRHLVPRRPGHRDQPRAARGREELLQPVRARARVRLPVAEAVRDEPALRAVRGDPADGDRAST